MLLARGYRLWSAYLLWAGAVVAVAAELLAELVAVVEAARMGWERTWAAAVVVVFGDWRWRMVHLG